VSTLTQERSEKIESVLKKAYDGIMTIIGLCFFAFIILSITMIGLFVYLGFTYESKKDAAEKSGCVHIQGVPGCYHKPEGDSVDPHPPSHDNRPRSSNYDYRPR